MKRKTWISALALVLAVSGLAIAVVAYLNSKRRWIGERDSRRFGDGCCCDDTGFEDEESYSEPAPGAEPEAEADSGDLDEE